jgi:hypothetical protein
MSQKQTKKHEPLKCTFGNCQKLQTGDGEFCEEHGNKPTGEYIEPHKIKKYPFLIGGYNI